MIAPIALAILAVALAWPVPVLLARATWPSRSPAVALVLWQAIAIAGGLSMIGALLTFAVGDDLVVGLIALAAGSPLDLPHALALAAAALLTVHLLLNLGLTVVRAERQRRRHAQLVLLLSAPMAEPAGARILDSPAPVAYCLPGAMSSVTVVSAGLVDLLSSDELAAVIEHERAHATQRHDVVLVLFRAWYASLPWFPIAFRAQREVGLLIEMLADDRARRVADDSVLARAIMLVGAGGPSPDDAEWPAGASIGDLTARITRLGSPPLPRIAQAAVVALALALLAVPTALLLTAGAALDAGRGEQRAFPAAAVVDYQLGGAYAPPEGVTVVTRDSTSKPAAGLYSICYVNGFQTQPGVDWPEQLVLHDAAGDPLVDANWPDENIIDISTDDKRNAAADRQFAAIDGCAAAGFDAVEFDNLDSYTRSDDMLSLDDAVSFATLLVDRAHHEGLAAGQKNTGELGPRGRDEIGFDFAVVEECDQFTECDSFTAVYGSAVIDIEYIDDLRRPFVDVCADPLTPASTVLRDRDLVPAGAPGYVFEHC